MFSIEATSISDLARGAIAGALVIAIVYLAGFAIFRRGAAAVCAFLMVASAAALQFSALDFIAPPPPRILVLLQGLFAASALIFLSATIKVARTNAILGGVMFAAALSLVGLGVINLIARADAGGLMRGALFAVGGFAALLAALQARHDAGARLILPGALIVLAAPLAQAVFGDSVALAPQALFTLGVLAAGLVALTETATPRFIGHIHEEAHGEGAIAHHDAIDHAEKLRASENQLAQVLDYSGVAVWDWCPHGAHQTDGLATLMGADSRGQFTPESIRAFVHRDDVGKFERKILGEGQGDGGFDVVLKLHDGRHMRFRGARAVHGEGELERIVAFVESVADPARAMRSSAMAPAAAAATPLSARLSRVDSGLAAAFPDALARGEIAAAFQPIVSLQTGKVAGYEALARWRGARADRAGAEELVRAAEGSGKSGALAQFMLEASTAHLAAQLKGSGARGLFVAMNVSYDQISEPEFTPAVRKALREHALPAKSLVLELTEAQAIADARAAGAIFRTLREAGAALAFDDFGAGFSSLSNLHKFSFDYLKIDKSFVETLARGGDGAKIARAVAGLGRELGLTVIAEGVETKELAEAARAAGCELGQGFAFGAAAAAEPPRRKGQASEISTKRARASELR